MQRSPSAVRVRTLAACVAAACCGSAIAAGSVLSEEGGRIPNTGNTSSVVGWRFVPGQVFGGVAGAMDGVARINFNNASGNYACSGSLMQGGQYVLTAAHCADNFSSMTVNFGWAGGSAAVTRSVTEAVLHPTWLGFENSADAGNDLALVRLSAPVTTIGGYALSGSNDVGKTYLMAGYGTTSVGSADTATNWGDSGYGHYGWNTFDVDSKTFNRVVDAVTPGWGYDAAYFVGTTYMSDYDGPNGSYNTLGKVASLTGGFTSGGGLGANEALIAGGDSGGGDFVLEGGQWLLSAVHSWGWQGNSVCGLIGGGSLTGCDISTRNASSYGDLSGATALFDQTGWINSVIAVPEPGTHALMLGGLLAVGVFAAKRKRA
ncbi:MAG: trypsin-like serine protease [Rubrivivax sp.]